MISGSGRGRMVLVVDPDLGFADAVRSLLDADRVVAARTMDEAAAIAEGRMVDVAIVGPSFGNEAGAASAAALRDADPALLSVLVADVPGNRVLRAALRAGMADVVDTPVTSRKLTEVLGRTDAIDAARSVPVSIESEPAADEAEAARFGVGAPYLPGDERIEAAVAAPAPPPAEPENELEPWTTPSAMLQPDAGASSVSHAASIDPGADAPWFIASDEGSHAALPLPVDETPPAAAPIPPQGEPEPTAPSIPVEDAPYAPVSGSRVFGAAAPSEEPAEAPPIPAAAPPMPSAAGVGADDGAASGTPGSAAEDSGPPPMPPPFLPEDDGLDEEPISQMPLLESAAPEAEAPIRELTEPAQVPSLGDEVPRSRRRPGAGMVLTVMAGKGGSGKTITATNLATALTERVGEDQVVIVDADLQFGDVALMLQVEPTRTIVEAAAQLDDLGHAEMDELLLRHPSGLRVLPAPLLPAAGAAISAKHVVRVVEILRDMYPFVVVDTGPVFDDGLITLLEHSDHVLVVVDMDLPSVKNAKIALDTLRAAGFDMGRIHLTVNRANSKARLDLAELERALGEKVDASIPSDRLIPQSVNEGVPAVAFSPRSRVAKAFHALADAFCSD